MRIESYTKLEQSSLDLIESLGDQLIVIQSAGVCWKCQVISRMSSRNITTTTTRYLPGFKRRRNLRQV